MHVTCPKCKSDRVAPHCTSPSCTWNICNRCTEYDNKTGYFTFDHKNRTMWGTTNYVG